MSADLENFMRTLNSKYKGANIHNIVDNKDGSMSIVLSGDEAGLDGVLSKLDVDNIKDLPSIDREEVHKLVKRRYGTSASIIRRDAMGSDYLDLPRTPLSSDATPQQMYERSMEYYKTEDVYGSSIDILTNFASKGFRNDIDDVNIRNFYDNWVIDTGIDKIVEQIFFEFFRSGFVRTYKVVGKYIPKISYVSPIPGQSVKKVSKEKAEQLKAEYAAEESKLETQEDEKAAKKIKWSKDYIPIQYTILNPTQIEIEKSSLLMDDQQVILKSAALEGIKELLETPTSELTEHQKHIVKNITAEMKKAAIDGEDLPLNPYLVGAVDYRRQPYELYPFPRGVRAFESMEYKKNLRDADYSTLDGITNFLLVITVGNDNFPIKGQEQLEAAAELFNTPSKAFNAVWDHTLKVTRVEPSDVGDILGQDKYKQVNDDITGAFGVIRALIDGVGSPTKPAADLATKSLLEEINYARREVRRWIYNEYRDVAEAMGFERYPSIRFDNMILKDEILMMTVIQGMLDRRILSYRLGHEMLGFDHDTIRSEMEEEAPLVQSGVLGILGSPYQQFRGGGGDVQETQRAPKGTPSEGRPKSKPAKTPKQPSDVQKPKAEKDAAAFADFLSAPVDDMTPEDLFILNKYIREKMLEKLSNVDEE